VDLKINLHVTFDGVFAIKECFWRHPLHWQSTLTNKTRLLITV